MLTKFTYDEIKHLLLRFLKENHALKPFMFNLWHIRRFTFDQYLSHIVWSMDYVGYAPIDYSNIIFHAFDGYKTKEGLMYWYSLDKKFEHCLNQYDIEKVKKYIKPMLIVIGGLVLSLLSLFIL